MQLLWSPKHYPQWQDALLGQHSAPLSNFAYHLKALSHAMLAATGVVTNRLLSRLSIIVITYSRSPLTQKVTP